MLCFSMLYWIEATCGLQSNGNAMSHSSGEALYVCAVAVLIEGGDNCEEDKLTVPCCMSAAEMLMWQEVEYHILGMRIGGLVSGIGTKA